jgi:hypothetical protein
MYLSARSCSIREDEDDVEIDEVDFLILVEDEEEDLFPSSRFRFKSSTYFDM